MAGTMDVWVVGFAPDKTARSCVGGFNWSAEWSGVEKAVLEHLGDGAGFDFLVRRVSVPVGSPDDVTEYLDANRDLWDPPAVQEAA